MAKHQPNATADAKTAAANVIAANKEQSTAATATDTTPTPDTTPDTTGDDVIDMSQAEQINGTENALIPFTSLHFAPAKSPRTFVDERSKVSSRQMVMGAAFIAGTQMHLKFIVGVRWKDGAQKKVEPYISMPTIGGRFNAGIDSDDSQTVEAFEQWKNETKAAAILWLTERAKKLKTTTSAKAIAPTTMVVDADALGLDLS